MAGDSQSQRRRAACAVLEPVLARQALLEELWVVHETMRGEAVSDIIGYVDGVARRQQLDAATCKRLYADLHKALRLDDARLPPDPWPAMQALRASAAPAPAAPLSPQTVAAVIAANPTGAPPMVMPASAVAATQPLAPPGGGAPAPASDPMAAINPVAAAMARIQPSTTARASGGSDREPQAVFAALLRAVMAEVHRYHREAIDDVRKDALRLVDDCGAAAPLCSAYREAWLRAQQHDWLLRGTAGDLAALVRVTYQALAEAFGRVGAEQIVQRGLRAAEGLPEARLYPPRRLLTLQ